MSVAAGPPRLRWLASDFNRNMLSCFLSAVAVAAILVVARPTSSTDRAQIIGWGFWGAYCLISAALVVPAYARLTGDALDHALLHGDDQGPAWLQRAMRRPVLRALISGTASAPTVAVAISGMNLLLVVLLMALDRLGRTHGQFMTIGVLTVAASWIHMWLMYAQHYGREDAEHGGLSFPGGGPATFTDYVYTSLAGQVTFGTTDVAITNSAMRRSMTGQALAAFVFNTVILAVLISIVT